ncbi:MAG: adenosylcobalamin-dependent ribonucleoside-diphosphate reductase [Pseudomonadota bacterium]
MGQVSTIFGPHAEVVLRRRYLVRDAQGRVVESPEQMLDRVAGAVAGAEERWGGAAAVAEWSARFFGLMAEGKFLPNSPTLMNAGRPRGQLSACFVLPVEDSLDSIFEAVKETALIHKSGGGTGFSFSRLRPAGDRVASTLGVSSGPVSFMQVFDVATEAIKQGGTRRGANMGLLSVRHPDIETFIKAKLRPGFLENFNISVMADDAFLAAVAAGADWELKNPRDGRPVRRLPAGELFDLLVSAAHASGEPGLAFYDAINRAHPTPLSGPLEATNPCGEQPLMPYESCNLGSLCLPAFVRGGELDWAALEEAAALAVRFLDDVVEVNRFPLAQVAQATRMTRKIGLGVMGFADLLVDLGIAYDSDPAVDLGGRIMAAIAAAGRAASAALGKARGSFPAFPQSRWRKEGLRHLRNATVTTVAPTGTLSLILGCSSGIEPYFALAYTRRVLEGEELVDLNPRFLKRLVLSGLDGPDQRRALAHSGRAGAVAGLDPALARLFATAHEVPASRHLAVQAAFQAHTDNGVSKTVNLPAAAGVADVRAVFLEAHALGLKGVTVFRHGCRGRQVLELAPLPGAEVPPAAAINGQHCPRCGGLLATDGGCRTCAICGASGCE